MRHQLENEACDAFRCWVSDLTVGELQDMLYGNARAYSGMPDLSPYATTSVAEKEMR